VNAEIRRALTDPWAIAVSLATGAAALLLGWGVGVAALALAAVLGVRVAAEHLVPRPVDLEIRYAAEEQEEQVRTALDRVTTILRGRVPAEVETRVLSIRQTILDVLARGAAGAVHSQEVFTALRTATDYLPAALDAYLRLPATYATSRRLEGGHTALELLQEQLELLDREMVEVADAVSRNDVARLLSHGKFLADRFGRSELTFQKEVS
jgi:hypothetical protein